MTYRGQKRRTVNPWTRISRRSRRAGLALALASTIILTPVGVVSAAQMITGQRIQDDSVTGRDLRDATVAGVDVRDAALRPRDYSGTVVGDPGPQGPRGALGPVGGQGNPGVRLIHRIVTSKVVLPGLGQEMVVVCEMGTVALSGGVGFNAGAENAVLTKTAPLNDGAGWTAGLRNEGDSELTAYLWAVCANA